MAPLHDGSDGVRHRGPAAGSGRGVLRARPRLPFPPNAAPRRPWAFWENGLSGTKRCGSRSASRYRPGAFREELAYLLSANWLVPFVTHPLLSILET